MRPFKRAFTDALHRVHRTYPVERVAEAVGKCRDTVHQWRSEAKPGEPKASDLQVLLDDLSRSALEAGEVALMDCAVEILRSLAPAGVLVTLDESVMERARVRRAEVAMAELNAEYCQAIQDGRLTEDERARLKARALDLHNTL